MHRREILAAAGTCTVGGLAGCLSTVLGADLPRRISLIETRARGIDVRVDVLEQLATRDHPSQVRITWTNPTNSEIALALYRDYPAPQVSRTDETYRTGLVLLAPQYDAEPNSDGCWRPSELRGRGSAPNLPLSPGERISHTYEVWTDPDEAACFPSGEYRFGTIEERWEIVLKVENAE